MPLQWRNRPSYYTELRPEGYSRGRVADSTDMLHEIRCRASKEEVFQSQNAVCLKLKQQETSEETVQADTVDPDIMAVLPEDAPAEHQAVIFFEL